MIHECITTLSKLQPYEQLYSNFCYSMFIINSLLFSSYLIGCYFKLDVTKLKYETMPSAVHIFITGFLFVAILTLTQPVGLPGIFGGYSVGILKVCFFKRFLVKIEIY